MKKEKKFINHNSSFLKYFSHFLELKSGVIARMTRCKKGGGREGGGRRGGGKGRRRGTTNQNL